MKNQNRITTRGFTLIELMIVIAIIGILASIALPSYRDYVRKSKMMEITHLIKAFHTKQIEFYNLNGRWPTQTEGNTVLGIGSSTALSSDLISTFNVDNFQGRGRIMVRVRDGGPLGDGGLIRHDTTESNGMFISTYCTPGLPTDEHLQAFLPNGC